MVYRIGYKAGDGTYRNFAMESNRRLPRSTETGCGFYGTPLLMDVMQEVQRRSETSKPMIKHGGYKELRYIKNESTNTAIYFNHFC